MHGSIAYAMAITVLHSVSMKKVKWARREHRLGTNVLPRKVSCEPTIGAHSIPTPRSKSNIGKTVSLSERLHHHQSIQIYHLCFLSQPPSAACDECVKALRYDSGKWGKANLQGLMEHRASQDQAAKRSH